MGTESPAEAARRRSTDPRRTCRPREAEPSNDLLPAQGLADVQRPRHPRERLVDVGWTKLAVIAENCAPEEMEEALALAETATAKELPALLKGAPRKAKARTVQLRLTPRQYDQFAAVLLANGARRPKKGRGLSGKEKALMELVRKAMASA